MDPLAGRKQENIAGYIISMWHLEDLMRAHRFDLEAIEELLVAPMDADEEARSAMRGWYTDLVQRMRNERIEERGHLSEVNEVMLELEYLHRSLIDILNDEEYDAAFAKAEPGITALQDTAGEDAEGPIATCFTAIYGVMVLRARQQEVSAATLEAEGHIRRLLDRLSQHYRQMRKLPGVSMN
jgi:flagellin-specific chaperone FliS